jgi:hypothetical protein
MSITSIWSTRRISMEERKSESLEYQEVMANRQSRLTSSKVDGTTSISTHPSFSMLVRSPSGLATITSAW